MAFSAKREFRRLSPSEIKVNPYQPRQRFTETELESLAESIRRYGIITPLTVRRVESGYELVAGERRLRCAKKLGLSTVPCFVVRADGEQSCLMALLENLQREDLDCFEEAESLRQLTETFGMTQQQAAQRIGKTQSAVANKLRLLRLTPAAVKEVRAGGLTERHARALLRLPEDAQADAAREMIRGQMTVARAERYVENLLQPKHRQKYRVLLRDVRIFCNTLEKHLSTLQESGIGAKMEQVEEGTDLLITIRVKNARKQAG
jgi:ParB family chromosome partitioning protein